MPVRRAILVAVAAATAGALLLGGNATYAAWSDSDSSERTTITAGDLRAEIAQTGPSAVKTGTSPGIYPTNGSRGIIPGIQAQRWTYTVTNSSDSDVAAGGTLEIKGSISSAADYAAILPYLRASATVAGNARTIPNSAFTSTGFSHTIALGEPLKPGKTVNVELTISMPATITNSQGKTVDVAVELLKYRSANTSTHQVFTMKNSAKLKQAGRS